MKLTKKDFKSVLVLLLIAIILSAILTVLNFVLYVSPEERTMRGIKAVYGEQKNYLTILEANDETPVWSDNYGFGEISKIYVVDDEIVNGQEEFYVDTDGKFDYLFYATGKGGYSGGSISCWVVVSVNGNEKAISKILQKDNVNQSLISSITQTYYDNMLLSDVTDAYLNGNWFYPKNNPQFTVDSTDAVLNPMSGATWSAKAACNTVNTVIVCVNEFNFGGND